ncbi:MAG: carbonic anhydrase [Anaerolineae bacterium]|nr:hypothetical protein [Anaerolineae bacterium]MDW8099530.1 carbonic anhydrase [Anaerolineae bacterium]
MDDVRQLLAGNVRFQREVFQPQQTRFLALARAQAPRVLFIGCVDSRVPPELITMAELGQMLVIRNVANLVPPAGSNESSVGAVIEFAINAFQIRDIIVCGHTGCGGIAALVHRQGTFEDKSPLGQWLSHAKPILTHTPPPGRGSDNEILQYYVEQNVILQLSHLASYEGIAQAVEARALSLHGWVYHLDTGGLDIYDKHRQCFVPAAAYGV